MKPVPSAVLDTNVVLDWLVFGDVRCRPLAFAIENGLVQVLGCTGARAELVHMLSSARLARWSPSAPDVLAHYDRWVCPCPMPEDLTLARPRCSDPDDQVFVDLALNQGARWLLTHDRAVLKLARRLRALGVGVMSPWAWQDLPEVQAMSDAGSAAPDPVRPGTVKPSTAD